MGKKRHVNRGVEKRCTCERSNWSTCPHPWTFRYKPRGRNRQQLSLDRLLGYHVDSRTDANTHANRIRTEMDAGTFKKDSLASAVSTDGVTLDHVITPFIERSYKKRNVESWSNAASMLQRLRRFIVNDRRLGDWPIAAITEDVLETFFESLSTFAAGTRTKYAQLLKRLFLWAKRKGYLTESPISDESTIKGEKGAERRRRIYGDEEDRLLAVAPLRLQSLIIAALESLCRLGELLALKWEDIHLENRTLLIAAEEVGARKTKRARTIPISDRLAAVLEMRRAAVAGEACAGTAYVFGDEIGRPAKSIKKAWETCVLKAHGYVPEWRRKGNSNGLSSESRARLRMIDLHFHDLRHEGGIRLLEKGWQLHWLQKMYGHASLAQTSKYLHADEFVLPDVMRQFEQKSAKRGAVVVQKRSIERQPLHHAKRTEASKSRPH
jgi:integrase/recombinase XerD